MELRFQSAYIPLMFDAAVEFSFGSAPEATVISVLTFGNNIAALAGLLAPAVSGASSHVSRRCVLCLCVHMFSMFIH